MTDEEIEKIAKKVLELQKADGVKTTQSLLTFQEVQHSLSWRITYCQELEKDLFENCENYVISKDRIKEQIKKYAKLSDIFYGKWKNLSPFDKDYKNIRDKGMCCDAIVNVLQELLKG